MASFYAELHVTDYVISLLDCSYGAQQATDRRGRVSSGVRQSLIENKAIVPPHQMLEIWAADPFQRQEATIIFYDVDATVLETLHLPAAYCTAYAEQFVSGDTHDGSYCCFFTLADPDGWHWYRGALPNPAAVQPPTRERGQPPATPAPGDSAAPLFGVAPPSAPGRRVTRSITALGAAIPGDSATALFGMEPESVPRLPPITGDPPFKIKGPKGVNGPIRKARRPIRRVRRPNGRARKFSEKVKMSSNYKPGLDQAEFRRQLMGQQDGLNRLTVAEFLANRDNFLCNGRTAEGDVAQKVARENALRDKVEELQLENENLTAEEAQEQAQQWVRTQTALHDPDQVAGGNPYLITGLGDARVNSSIGAQWPTRITVIDQQIRQYAAGMSQQEQESTYLNVVLPIV